MNLYFLKIIFIRLKIVMVAVGDVFHHPHSYSLTWVGAVRNEVGKVISHTRACHVNCSQNPPTFFPPSWQAAIGLPLGHVATSH